MSVAPLRRMSGVRSKDSGLALPLVSHALLIEETGKRRFKCHLDWFGLVSLDAADPLQS